MPNFAEVVSRLTVDPGYRYLGAKFDDVANGCTCRVRVPIPTAELSALLTKMRGGSLDPACAVLAEQLLVNIDACCSAIPLAGAGLYSTETAKLTVDPGARLVASLLDGYCASCCTSDPRA
jgi:hypothetical protein